MKRAVCKFIAIGLLATTCAIVVACCSVSNGERVDLADENVIIVWDEARQVQHFVRQARFDTKAKDFGFIVPTPSVPDFAVADPEAFKLLERLVPWRPGTMSDAAADVAPAGGVEVIKVENVGDYQVSVLRATDGKAMNSWLSKNGYVSRPAMEDWLDYYAKQKWVFSAFKFMKKEPTGTMTQAIRVSFKTKTPAYPYKMPKDTWPEGHRRPMNVYFIAANAMDSRYVGSDDTWEAKKRWSGALPEKLRSTLATQLKLKESDLPEGAIVTVFENGENPDGYDHDIYFAAATDWTPWIWGGAAAAALVVVVLTFRHRRPRMVEAT